MFNENRLRTEDNMGLAGFEPAIPSARGWYPTKLDHNPPIVCI